MLPLSVEISDETLFLVTYISLTVFKYQMKHSLLCLIYRKISKISPSKYKSPKPVTRNTLPLIAPPNISPPGACTWKFALNYKVKQSKNGIFTSNYGASPIDVEM